MAKYLILAFLIFDIGIFVNTANASNYILTKQLRRNMPPTGS